MAICAHADFILRHVGSGRSTEDDDEERNVGCIAVCGHAQWSRRKTRQHIKRRVDTDGFFVLRLCRKRMARPSLQILAQTANTRTLKCMCQEYVLQTAA